MKKKLFTLFLFFLSIQAFGQQQAITGKITSADDGLPLQGVTVKVKGTATGTVSDANGNYSINAKVGQTLVFSYLGFLTQEKQIDNKGSSDVKLASDVKSLNSIVVVGYGSQKRADLTGAVSTVNVDKTLGSRPITDVARGLQGAVPGLTITTTSGELGVPPKIRLRGITGSLNATDGAQPLILVDGVEMQSQALQMLNPNDIESISVLKDAASAAIYGTRAAWGVVLITTKSGKKGSPLRVNYSYNVAYSQPTVMPKIASSVEGAEMVLQALRRESNNPNLQSFGVLGMYFDSLGIEKMKAWNEKYKGKKLGPEMVMGRDFEIRNGDLYFYRPWDPLKMYVKNWTSQQTHNLSFSGGSKSTSYNLDLGYMGENGVLKVNPDKFDRYNASLGIKSSINKWLAVNSKLMVSHTLTTTPFVFGSTALGPWYYLLRWPAVYPYGTYEGKPFRSSLTEVQQAKMNQDENTLARIQLGTTITPLPGLTINVNYTYTSTNEHLHKVGGGTSGIDFWAGQLNYLDNYQSPSYDYVEYNSNWDKLNTGKAYVTYSHKIKDHSFKVMAGSDLDLYLDWGQGSQRRQLIDPNLGEINLATGDQYVSGYRGQWSTLGYFGRINYMYKNKYLLELNGRYDGSSRFPNNAQWAFFPSMSAGYILSEEKFMQPIKNYLNFLKFRGSWGTIGNQDVGYNRFLSVMGASTSGWWIGSSNEVTFSTPQEVDNSLTWEKVSTIDLGVDARMFRDHFGVSFDWYQRTTSDMISPGITLPSAYGGNNPVRNYGAMQATGWELSLDFHKAFSNNLHLNATLVLSDFKEKITKYANSTKGINSNYTGKTLGEIWGYETDRLFTEDDFNGKDDNGRWIPKKGIADQTLLEGNSNWFNFGPGDVKYKDLNGDGKITPGSGTTDDPGDMKVIGNSTPRYQYGLRVGADWKGFDVSVFLQGVGKRELWPLGGGPVFIPGFYVAEAWYQHQTDYWTPDNPDAYYPRPTDQGGSANKNFYKQSRYLLDMSYLRLKNLQIGYTIPKSIVNRYHIVNLRIYFSGANLLTHDNLKVPIDPEVDYTPAQWANAGDAFGRVYPYRKTLSFGIQLTL